jgi:hypothetical protein
MTLCFTKGLPVYSPAKRGLVQLGFSIQPYAFFTDKRQVILWYLKRFICASLLTKLENPSSLRFEDSLMNLKQAAFV